MKKEMGILFSLIILVIALLAGCTSTFLVTKDGKSYFFGSRKEGLYKMLCESGDLTVILADTQLPSKIKDDLYKYNCGPAEQSGEKIAGIYTSMTPEQRRELRFAFQKHGYDINYLVC